MSKLSTGILGPIRGKISNTVGVKRGNLNILIAKPVRTKQASDLQKLQNERFKETQRMMQVLKPAIQIGFKTSDPNTSSTNIATRKNAAALIGDFPDFMWDYSAIKVSQGGQSPIYVSQCESIDSLKVQVDWSDNADSGTVLSLISDKVTFVFLSEEKNQLVIKSNAAVREDLSASITLPQAFVGDTIHVWTFVKGSATNQLSNSTYMGNVILA
jgi:hypothetical protein